MIPFMLEMYFLYIYFVGVKCVNVKKSLMVSMPN